MTNREYLAQNPEEMRGMIKKASDYVENTYGAHTRLMMTDDELLDKWLNSECEPDPDSHARRETTYIVNLALTMHHADSLNADEALQTARVAAQVMKRAFKEIPSLAEIDDVTIERIKVFIWG